MGIKKLWQKNWKLHSFVEEFETKDDIVLDQRLAGSDVLGSLAHAAGLMKIGILEPKEFASLARTLQKIYARHQRGQFILRPGDEDMHTKIENELTQQCGAAGKKIHTGRSRNDQVLTALRLFTKENLLNVWDEALRLVTALQAFAKKYASTPMPGYTHLQRAMPWSVGLWANAHAAGLLDSLITLQAAYEFNDRSPLGSAAGFGSPLALPREYTARLLGFSQVQNNPLACQNSRGKIEAVVLSALIALLTDVNKMASDITLFTTTEFNFLSVAPELCSGSSIMPQKKNVDIAELLRSKVHIVLGHYVQIVSLSSNLPSGYNRDLQDSKKPLVESLKITIQSLRAAALLIEHTTPNTAVLAASLTPELFATDHAYALVRQGMPFREAYAQAARDLSDGKISAHQLPSRITALARQIIPTLERRRRAEEKIYQRQHKKYNAALQSLWRRAGIKKSN